MTRICSHDHTPSCTHIKLPTPKDSKIQPCNPLWNRQQSTQAFATRAQFCATCIVNGFYALCRDVTDTYCVNLDTILPCGDIIPHP